MHVAGLSIFSSAFEAVTFSPSASSFNNLIQPETFIATYVCNSLALHLSRNNPSALPCQYPFLFHHKPISPTPPSQTPHTASICITLGIYLKHRRDQQKADSQAQSAANAAKYGDPGYVAPTPAPVVPKTLEQGPGPVGLETGPPMVHGQRMGETGAGGRQGLPEYVGPVR